MSPRTEFSRREYVDYRAPAPVEEPIVHKPQVQPPPIVFKGECNRYYETKRNGRIIKVWLVEVRKDQAVIKDAEADKHTRKMSLAEFVKFYA